MTRNIIKQIEDAYVVWFEKSNQWVLMNEHQGFLFQLYSQGVIREHVVELFYQEFGKQTDINKEWVLNHYDSIEKLDKSGFPFPDFSIDAIEAKQYPLDDSLTHHYRLGDKTFAIRYGGPFLESYMHLPFHHLTHYEKGDVGLLLEVFPFNGRYALRINNDRCLTADESPQIKRLLFVALAGYLYDIADHGWLTHLHASGVVHNDKLLLLASPSGSGKSTMAALLQHRGYSLFADDFIPTCLSKKLLYPFPAALSIKSGSLPVMEAAGIKPGIIHRQTGYLQHNADNIAPMQAGVMVFINYEKDAATRLEKVATVDALLPFLQEAWVNNTCQGAKEFLEWFCGLEFYSLTYSDNKDAMLLIDSLMQ